MAEAKAGESVADTGCSVEATSRAVILSNSAQNAPVRRQLCVLCIAGRESQALELGRIYSVTALADPGQVFAGWTGSIQTNASVLSFVMARDLVLQANFAPDPFPSRKGAYNGLFRQGTSDPPQNVGSIAITTTAKSRFTSKVVMGKLSYALSGAFDGHGHAELSLRLKDSTVLKIILDLDVAGTSDRITGNVSNGSWNADLVADRLVFDKKTNPFAQAGRYTLAIPGSEDASQGPQGNGWATIQVDAGGKIQVSGSFADGTKFSLATTVAKDGRWPFYIPLFGGKGLVIGWSVFGSVPSGDLAADLSWYKSGGAGNNYLNGFSIRTMALGSRYVTPTKTTNLLFTGPGQLMLSGGGLQQAVTNQILLNSTGKIVNLGSNKIGISFNLATGSFSGSAKLQTVSKALSLSGVVLQREGVAVGYFLNNGNSGGVRLDQN